MHSVIIACTI